MQLFLLKIISLILIINVDFSRSYCNNTVCRASCYWTHKGFDYGYCENGKCKCDPPIVYVFDGVGRDLSDADINNSLNNNNVIQRTIPTYNQNPKSTDTLNEITETVTETQTQTNTANRKGTLRRTQGQILDNNISKPNVNTEKNKSRNSDSKLNNKKGTNEQNKNKPKQVDQKLGENSNDSSDYEVKRNTKKTVTHEEEENNQHDIVEEYSEEFVTVEVSGETSEEKH